MQEVVDNNWNLHIFFRMHSFILIGPQEEAKGGVCIGRRKRSHDYLLAIHYACTPVRIEGFSSMQVEQKGEDAVVKYRSRRCCEK